MKYVAVLLTLLFLLVTSSAHAQSNASYGPMKSVVEGLIEHGEGTDCGFWRHGAVWLLSEGSTCTALECLHGNELVIHEFDVSCDEVWDLRRLFRDLEPIIEDFLDDITG